MIYRTLAIFLMLFLLTGTSAFAESDDGDYPDYDKPEKKKKKKKEESNKKKHDLVDTKKKLDIRKGDLVDTKKGLDIRTGDLMDTKKMLRKTAFPNAVQLLSLKKDLASKLKGVRNYQIANKRNSELVSTRLKLSWKIKQEQFDLSARNQSLKVKDISDGRKKFLKDKISEINKNIKQIKSRIEDIDESLIKIVANEKITGSGDYFDNQVTSEHGVDLMDKFGNPKHRVKKGAKLQTKVSTVDANNFFMVKYKGEIYYVGRENFKIK